MVNKNYWSSILLIEIFLLLFVTGFFPDEWNSFIFPLLYSALYLTAAVCLERNKKTLLWVAGLLLVAQVIFNLVDMPVIAVISKLLNFLFFGFIVISLVRQIASAQHVTGRVILNAVNGYLLMGLVFTFLVAIMIQFDALAFNFSGAGEGNHHDSMYFGFVTFATLGYGDMFPVKSYAKSLSILIAVSGQLYLAVIIALLVGKFSAQSQK